MLDDKTNCTLKVDFRSKSKIYKNVFICTS